MDTFDIADLEDISPWDALLLGVKRRARRVRICDRVTDEVMKRWRAQCEETGEGNPEVPPQEARAWMAESRNEERILQRTAKMAIDAGVAEAMIRRLDMEGRLITDALVAGLDSLDLSPDQRIHALESMHQALVGDRELPGGDALPPQLPPSDDES
jgi:hypothetical protein